MERTETQRRILEVGKKEFLEKGFKDASLNQIVAEAGFTKGAFYGYYPDKTALFEDLVGETASELLTRFKAAQVLFSNLMLYSVISGFQGFLSLVPSIRMNSRPFSWEQL